MFDTIDRFDTFQNIFLGIFLLIVMVFTNNVEGLKELLHKKPALRAEAS